jgi:hypothetical protein
MLTWSWKAAAKGCAQLLILMLVFWDVTGLARFVRAGDFVPAMVLGGVVIAAIAGMRPVVREMKTLPNQGIRLSVRCALHSALIVELILTLILWPLAFMSRSEPQVRDAPVLQPLWGGLIVGLVLGLSGALLAGAWLGGIDVILHYFLRLLLYMKGRTPLNLVRFLDYAAKDLNFLQKVGGGYIFIHRMLLEHFAAMRTEEKSDPPETSALAPPTPFESV